MTRQVVAFAVALGALCVAISCSSSPAGQPGTAQAKAAQAAPAPVTPAMLDQGRGLYKTYCAPCHGESGRGDGPAAGVMKPAPRDHTDGAYMSKLSDEELGKVIQMGGAMRGMPLMPSNPQIKGADLAAVIAYTRSLSAAGAN